MGSGINFSALVSQIAEIQPDRVAIVSDGRTRTFAELAANAEHLARGLVGRGLGPGSAAGLLLSNRLEYLEAFFGVARLGGVPFNVNYRYRAHEVTYLLDNASAEVLFYEPELAEVATQAADMARVRPLLVARASGSAEPAISQEDLRRSGLAAGDVPLRDPEPEDLFYLYTGGTTGLPKAVMWRHEDLFEALWQLSRPGRPVADPVPGIASGRRARTALPASPLMHGTALFIALQTLAGAGTVVLCEGAGFDPHRTIDTIRAHEVQLLSIVGDAFARPLVDALRADGGKLPSLEVIVSSGVPWSASVKQELLDLIPDVMLIDSLGASEGPGAQAISRRGEGEGGEGRFKIGGRMRVIDEDGTEVEPGSGVVGMVAMAGPGPIGYLGDPERSAATFRTIEGEHVTVPGDLATVDLDGTITFLGRGSACVNTGGEKVYPEEVESVLRSHPRVRDCAIVGVPDPRWGERVVALVDPQGEGGDALAAELDAACLDALAPYKRPRDYLFWTSLERSAAGKLDLVALRERAAQELAQPGAPA